MSSARDKMNSFGDSAVKAGGMMTAGLTLPLVGIGTTAIKAGIDFESAFAGVKKTVDATDSQFAMLSDGIRDMSKEIPASAVEIAGVAEAAGQLGIQTDNILGFTRTMVDLGVATNLSSEEAATSLARLANITQMPQDEFSNLGSTIVALGNNLATTEADITAMGLRIAGAGHQVGMTEADILSFAGALSSVGIEAEAGGSAMSRVMVDMANAVAQGGDDLEGFANVAGMSASSFAESFQNDPANAIISFIEGLGGISDAGGNVFQTLDDLGLSEIRVRDTLLRASGAGDLFRESLELGNQAWQENTALSNEASQRYATTASQLAILRNKAADVATTFGSMLLPIITGKVVPMFDRLVGFVSNAGEWFSRLSPNVKSAALAFVGMLAAAGPMLLVFGQLIKVLAFIASPLGILVLALGLLAAAFASDFMGIRTITLQVVDAILPKLQQLADWFMSTALPAIQGFAQQATQFFTGTILPAVSGFVDAVLPRLQQFGDWFTTTAIPAISNFATQVQTFFTGTILPAINSFIDTVLPKLQQFGDWIVVTAIPAVLGLRDNLVNGFNTIQTAVMAALTTLWPYLQAVFNGIREAAAVIIPQLMAIWNQLSAQFTAASPLIQNLKELFDQLKPVLVTLATIIGVALVVAVGVVLGVLRGLAGFVSGTLPGAFQALSGVIQVVTGIIKVFTSIVTGLVATVAALIRGDWSAAWDSFKTMVKGAADGVKDIVNGLKDVVLGIISGLVDGVIGFISGLVDGIIDYFRGLYNTLVGNSIIPDLVNGILDWIGKLPGEVLQLIVDFVTGAVEQFTNLLTGGTEKITELYNTVTQFVSDLATEALETVTGWVTDVVQGFTNLVTDATEQAQNLYNDVTQLVSDLATAALETVTTMAGDVVQAFTRLVTDAVTEVGKLPGKITDTLGDLSGLLTGIGSDIVGGLIDGVKSRIGDLKGVFDSITGLIPDWKGPAAKDKKLLRPAGQMVMSGFIEGVNDKRGELRQTLEGVTRDVTGTFQAALGEVANTTHKTLKRTADDAETEIARIKQALMVNVNEMRIDAEKQLTELWATAKAQMDAVKAMYEKRAGEIQSAIKAGMDPEEGKAQLADLKAYTDTVLHQIQTKAAEEAAAIRESLETNIVDANETAQAQIAEIEASISDGTEAAADATAENSGDMQQSFTESLETMKSEALQRLGELQTIVSEALWGMKPDAIRAGLALGRGFIDGIQHTWPRLRQVGEATAQIVIDAIRSQLDIASPSRVTENQGVMIGRGLVDGLRSMHSLVQRESDRLGMAAMPTIPNLATGRAAIGVGGFDDEYSGGGGIVMHFHGDMNVRNDADIGLIAGRIGDTVSAKLRARGQR